MRTRQIFSSRLCKIAHALSVSSSRIYRISAFDLYSKTFRWESKLSVDVKGSRPPSHSAF
jgi:hypothetical protein